MLCSVSQRGKLVNLDAYVDSQIKILVRRDDLSNKNKKLTQELTIV